MFKFGEDGAKKSGNSVKKSSHMDHNDPVNIGGQAFLRAVEANDGDAMVCAFCDHITRGF